MKVVAISDTHCLHDRLTLPEGDVLVHAGDFCNYGDIPEVARFHLFLSRVSPNYKEVIVIAGNHDRIFESQSSLAESLLRQNLDNVHYLRDSSVTIDGIKFYGSPWQPAFNNWAFNLERGEEIASKWALIPEDTDVLITHGPPYGILDDVAFPNDGKPNLGCVDLVEAVKRISPTFHVFGHIHIDLNFHSTQVEERDGTTFINASICNDNYLPKNPPVIFKV